MITLTQDGHYHARTKHIDIFYHFIWYIVQAEAIKLPNRWNDSWYTNQSVIKCEGEKFCNRTQSVRGLRGTVEVQTGLHISVIRSWDELDRSSSSYDFDRSKYSIPIVL